MSYIERKRYVIYITTAFLTGVVLYGFLGLLLFNDRDIIARTKNFDSDRQWTGRGLSNKLYFDWWFTVCALHETKVGSF